MQVLDLGHQGLVDRQPAGGVDQQHVEVVALGVVQRRQRDIVRLLFGRGFEPLGAGLARHGLELLDGGRTVDVGRDGQHLLLALFDQVLGELGGRRRLAGALQAGHQDDGGRLGGKVDVGHTLAHGRREFLVHDRHQHLAGVQRADHLLAQRLLLDPRDEVAHDGQGHVGLEQGHAHLAQHVLHIAVGDAGLAAHRLDEATQAVGEGGSHRMGRARSAESRQAKSTLRP